MGRLPDGLGTHFPLQIEDLLRRRRQENADRLLGLVVMTMGLELRAAYIKGLAVLPDGTLISGSDDGHVHLWRHGQLVRDVVHHGLVGLEAGGVDALACLPRAAEDGGLAFATAGRGCVRFWTAEGGDAQVQALPAPMGTTPSSLVAMELGGADRSLSCARGCCSVCAAVCHPCPCLEMGACTFQSAGGGGGGRVAHRRRRRGTPRPKPSPPPDQHDRSGKKRNFQSGISCRAIFGTQTFGSQSPPPFFYYLTPPPLVPCPSTALSKHMSPADRRFSGFF